MSLLDLLESIAGAPRGGMGAGPGVAGGAPATGGSSPPMCQPPMPDLGDPGSPLEPMSWDPALHGSLDVDAGSPAGDGDGGVSAEEGSFTKDRVVLDQLDKYHDWMTQDDSVGKRALRALPGLVILPMGAVLACLENTIRSPVPGVTIEQPRLSR